jgi:hypothetical protein
LVGACLAILVGTALTVLPVQGALGLNAAYLGALEVTVAAALATFLVWYGLRA